ncbi:MAG: SDR family oxidoreductase [Methylococcaceae bacterium]|jgi:NAD(P)-dependent dehydrogenase (short-subunit alcohol dehydrogenase family)
MNIQNCTALVTGANRGIGKAYIEALANAGAKRIYATARTLESLAPIVAIAPDRIIPLALDITKPEQVNGVAGIALDVNLLINNAGILGGGSGAFADDSLETAQREMQTNYFGTYAMCLAFAPILKNNAGGALVNLLSIASVVGIPSISSYCASKAALHGLTQGMRAELKAQGTLVVGVYPGPIDTDMAAGIEMEKFPPLDVANRTLTAIENNQEDVYTDPVAEHVFSGLSAPLKAIEQQFSAMLPQA